MPIFFLSKNGSLFYNRKKKILEYVHQVHAKKDCSHGSYPKNRELLVGCINGRSALSKANEKLKSKEPYILLGKKIRRVSDGCYFCMEEGNSDFIKRVIAKEVGKRVLQRSRK